MGADSCCERHWVAEQLKLALDQREKTLRLKKPICPATLSSGSPDSGSARFADLVGRDSCRPGAGRDRTSARRVW